MWEHAHYLVSVAALNSSLASHLPALMPSACHASLLVCGRQVTVLPRLLLMCVSPLPLFLPSKQKYYNVRADYIAAFYDVINWKGVSDLYAAALQVRGSVMV